MKVIASGLLALGLLAIQISEADAAACAAGRYHAGCVGPRGAVATTHRPYGYHGAAVVRPCLWRAMLLARRRARLPLGGHASPRLGRRSRSPRLLARMRREGVAAVDRFVCRMPAD